MDSKRKVENRVCGLIGEQLCINSVIGCEKTKGEDLGVTEND